MIKRLICLTWGCVRVQKAFTGKTQKVTAALGNKMEVGLYKWKELMVCPRCGRPNKFYSGGHSTSVGGQSTLVGGQGKEIASIVGEVES